MMLLTFRENKAETLLFLLKARGTDKNSADSSGKGLHKEVALS